MTISIDSIWVLFGIAVTLGAGCYLGVLYMVLSIRAGKKLGVLVADYIALPLIAAMTRWRQKWKK